MGKEEKTREDVKSIVNLLYDQLNVTVLRLQVRVKSTAAFVMSLFEASSLPNYKHDYDTAHKKH